MKKAEAASSNKKEKIVWVQCLLNKTRINRTESILILKNAKKTTGV